MEGVPRLGEPQGLDRIRAADTQTSDRYSHPQPEGCEDHHRRDSLGSTS